MSNLKHDAIVAAGIGVQERVPLPVALVPSDARVEIDAKLAAGYFTDGVAPDASELGKAKGRALE